MTKLLIALMFFVYSANALGATVVCEEKNLTITTRKVAHLEGDIRPALAVTFASEMKATENIPGPRIIIIDSPGGSTRAGDQIIRLIEMEKKAGVKQVCIVLSGASSMAFNILTHCDIRLAYADAMMVVHKIAYYSLEGVVPRLTAYELRKVADELDRSDESYRQANAKAMGLSLKDYDRAADKDTAWSAETLINRNYLYGLGELLP